MATVEFTAHPAQGRVLTSNKRIIFAVAGRQGGKTTVGAIWTYKQAQEFPEDNGLIASPTYDILHHSTLEKFFEYFPALKKYYRKKDRIIYLPTGGKIFCRSTDKPEHLEGLTLKYIWADEADGMDYKTFLILRSRVTTTNGKILITTSFYSSSWIAREVLSKRENLKYYDVITWASIENPAFPRQEWEHLKATLDPMVFERYYKARPTFAQGLVFPYFDEEKDVLESAEGIEPEFFIIGIDYGAYDPTVVGVYAVYKNFFIIWDELYKPGVDLTTIKSFLLPYKDKIKGVFADPSQKVALLELARDFPVYDNKTKAVLDGIYILRGLFYHHKIKLLKRCQHHLHEFKTYSFKSTGVGFSDEPEDKNNHCVDALRYAVASYYLTNPKRFDKIVVEEKKEDNPYSWFWERKRRLKENYLKKQNLWKHFF